MAELAFFSNPRGIVSMTLRKKLVEKATSSPYHGSEAFDPLPEHAPKVRGVFAPEQADSLSFKTVLTSPSQQPPSLP
jgi:hypothetical protein